MKKSLGNKRKQVGDGKEERPNHIDELTRIYGNNKNDEKRTLAKIVSNIEPERDQSKEISVSKIFNNQDFGYIKITVERPLRLNFAVNEERINRFKATDYYIALARSKKKKDKKAKQKEEKTGEEIQTKILNVLDSMNKELKKDELIKNRKVFDKMLKKGFKNENVAIDKALMKVLLGPGCLGEKDPTAEICYDTKGDPEPDPELRDNENVQLPNDIELPLPLEYESKKKKGKLDINPLLDLVKDHCDKYFVKEVLPYRPDAWVDYTKTKVGYEIAFNRHFYQYEPPRLLKHIENDLSELEKEIINHMKAVMK